MSRNTISTNGKSVAIRYRLCSRRGLELRVSSVCDLSYHASNASLSIVRCCTTLASSPSQGPRPQGGAAQGASSCNRRLFVNDMEGRVAWLRDRLTAGLGVNPDAFGRLLQDDNARNLVAVLLDGQIDDGGA